MCSTHGLCNTHGTEHENPSDLTSATVLPGSPSVDLGLWSSDFSTSLSDGYQDSLSGNPRELKGQDSS